MASLKVPIGVGSPYDSEKNPSASHDMQQRQCHGMAVWHLLGLANTLARPLGEDSAQLAPDGLAQEWLAPEGLAKTATAHGRNGATKAKVPSTSRPRRARRSTVYAHSARHGLATDSAFPGC